jgi:lysyl endopeptidase
LVRLNNVPPANYRPYLVGWNRKNIAPSSSISIHHPLGDIKKISVDRDPAVTSKFNSNYLPKGFWNVLRWESGVTEQGSSGGPLIDQNKQLVGTLTGGSAGCPPSSPENDYFAKFALAWDYRAENSKQLKAWLDPIGSNVEKLEGMDLNSDKMLCEPVTNFLNTDTHTAIQISTGITKKGYWSGSNSDGFTEFAEKFTFSKNCEISGISLGVAKAKLKQLNSNSSIDVQVYEGTDKPEKLVYTEKFSINKFYADAMNTLSFANPVKTTGSFFVSYNVSKLNAGDTLVVYMANRQSVTNSFYLKNNDGWSTYNSQNQMGYGSALLVELIACNVDDSTNVDTLKSNVTKARFFPNPLSGNSTCYVETVDKIDSPELIKVYDLLGKEQNISYTQTNPYKVGLNFAGKRSGIYFVHLEAGGKHIVGKVAYLP